MFLSAVMICEGIAPFSTCRYVLLLHSLHHSSSSSSCHCCCCCRICVSEESRNVDPVYRTDEHKRSFSLIVFQRISKFSPLRVAIASKGSLTLHLRRVPPSKGFFGFDGAINHRCNGFHQAAAPTSQSRLIIPAALGHSSGLYLLSATSGCEGTHLYFSSDY